MGGDSSGRATRRARVDAMQWASLFFRSQGRIGRGPFWIGFILLGAVQSVACLLPHASWIAFMLLAYGWICLYAKRLHDMGHSGWLTVAPILANLLALSAAAAFWLRAFSAKGQAPSVYWMALTALSGAGLIDLLFVAWVGLSPGEADENPYGPGATQSVGEADG